MKEFFKLFGLAFVTLVSVIGLLFGFLYVFGCLFSFFLGEKIGTPIGALIGCIALASMTFAFAFKSKG